MDAGVIGMLAVATATALAVGLAAFAALSLVFSEDRRVQRALRDLPAYETGQMKEAEPLLASFRERVVSPAAGSVARMARRASPRDARDRLSRRLAAAGMPGSDAADRFLAAKVGAASAGVLLAVAGWMFGPLRAPGALLAAVVLGAAGYFAPELWLSNAMTLRKSSIRRDLPDVLDMLTISIRAGLGFDGALAKLVRTGSGPLMEEFSRMLAEVQAGASRRDALRAMAHRADVPELGTFVSAMVQADVFGISVASVLTTQSSELRLRRRQHAEETAQKAPVKLVFPVLLCILPATLLVIGGPAVMAIGRAFGMVD